jgi:hypothetical protein
MSAIEALMGVTNITGVKARNDLGTDIQILLSHGMTEGGAILSFSERGEGRIIEILGMLHDSMDPIRHVPDIAKE